MQIGQQVLHILPVQHLAIARHIRAAIANNLAHAVVVGGQSGLRKILMLKYAFQSRAFFPFGRISMMAAVAIVIVNFASGGLLRIEAEFGIGFAALDVACG